MARLKSKVVYIYIAISCHHNFSSHQDIDDPKVLVEPVANKLDSTLQEIEQLQVAGLESGEVLGAHGGIQVSRLDARELSQIVHHLCRVRIFSNLDP